ncbi:MAG: AAA family ATPase [Bacilli bacterium]|nr:AAA family ATPase [Bacilli bacterium]
MFYIAIFILVIILIFKFRHTKIKFKTFFKKGFSALRGRFGVYCYCGKQGSGKTYSAVEFLLNDKDMEIYSNVGSIKGVDYTYFNGFDKLLELRNKTNCIIFYDEIFTALTKSSKMTNDVLDFLSQMRKRKIIFITTAQEWLEINITLRRYCRYQIECSILSIAKLSILIKRMYNAEQLKWSNEDNEYVAPLIETTISKCNLSVANSYDTFEQIKTKI